MTSNLKWWKEWMWTGSRVLLISFFVILAVILYSPGLDGGLYFDDNHVLSFNQFLTIDSLDWQSLKVAANSFEAGGRQISMLSFALNYYFSQDWIKPFKVTNLVLHICVGLVLFAFLHQLLKTAPASFLKGLGSPNLMLGASVFAAGLWIIAPMNLGTVLYISQRMTILAFLFVSLGLFFYVLIRQSRIKAGIKMPLLLLVTVLFTVLAYLSKENGVLLIPYIGLLEIYVFSYGSFTTFRSSIKPWVVKLVLLIAAVVVIVAAIFFLAPFYDRMQSGFERREFSFTERVLTQFRALGFYLTQILVPDNSELSMWHDDFEISRGLFQPMTTFLSAVIVISLLFLGVFLRFRVPLLGLAIFWFFVGHSIESTILPLEMVHEHRNYFASFGVLLFVVTLVLASQRIRPMIQAIILGGLVVLNGGVLHARSQIWSSDVTKAVHEASSRPLSSLAQFGLARQLYLAAIYGENDKAAEQAQHVLRANMVLDEVTLANETLLIMLSEQTDVQFDPAWVKSMVSKLENPKFSPITSSAIASLTEYIQKREINMDVRVLDPLYDALAEHGNPKYMTYAAMYEADITKQYDRAKQYFQKIVATNPKNPYFQLNLMRMQIKLRQYSEACKIFSKLQAGSEESKLLLSKELSQAENWLEGKCNPAA